MIENFNFVAVLYEMASYINTNFYLVLAFIILFSVFFISNKIEKDKRMNKIDRLLDLLIEEKEINQIKVHDDLKKENIV